MGLQLGWINTNERCYAQAGDCLVDMPGPFNVYDILIFENSMVHIKFQDVICCIIKRLAEFQKNMNEFTRIYSRSTASLGLIMWLYWLNATIQGLCHCNLHLLGKSGNMGILFPGNLTCLWEIFCSNTINFIKFQVNNQKLVVQYVTLLSFWKPSCLIQITLSPPW